jgi:hypothetical protein
VTRRKGHEEIEARQNLGSRDENEREKTEKERERVVCMCMCGVCLRQQMKK